MEEVWKDVVEYEGIYMVSSLGRIKSIDRVVRRRDSVVLKLKGKLLSQKQNGVGYLMVSLCNKGTRKQHLVHRCVASAFLLNHNNKPTVNHKNGVKTDNNYSNLEFCTQSENNKHAYRLGLRTPPMKGHFGKLNKQSRPVCQYDFLGNLIREYECQNEAARNTGIDNSSISKVCRGVIKSAGGFDWKFKEQ